MSEAGIPADKLLAAAAAAPGAVDNTRGVVVALAPHLKGWEQMPMAEMLRESLGGVPVQIENDVNLAIMGERWRGAARGHNTCAFIYVGTGIGAGIVVNGDLHRGHHFLAGEIGLMCMSPENLGDDYIENGCLENLASLKAVGGRGTGVNASPKQKNDILGAAQKGDRKAKKIVEEAAQLVGIATTNLVLTLDPSLVVLAGPVVENPTYLEQVRHIVARIIPSPPEIALAKLGEEASLWGSLLLATQEARASLRQRLRA
jgi:predicted NBD/HSP70 family sugar kinase